MSVLDRRSRSTTAISQQRPLSRDSTASLQSVAPRPAHNRANSLSLSQFAQQYVPQQQSQQHFESQSQYPGSQGLLQHHQQYQSHGLPLQPAQAQYHPHQQQVPTHSRSHSSSMYHSHSISQGYNNSNAPQQPTSNQYNNTATHQDNMPRAGPSDEKKKSGGAAATQSNERELREALDLNVHRSLKDIAKEVSDSERTSRAEKTKQLFAMVWLNTSCETAKTSVPRSIVYASYADRCATECVTPLNPASFGKLVRIIFKDIATRRLGVRGESKYHYVDLALKSEQEQEESVTSHGTFGQAQSPSAMTLDFNNVPLLPINGVTYAPDGSPIDSPVLAPRREMGLADGAVFADPMNQSQYRSAGPYSQTYPQQLCFPSSQDDIIPGAVELPDLWPYAPESADEDAARPLMALYRSHCTSLIEYFKKCKEKQFWRTFTTFQGTLTVPVQKLLTNPSMAAWVRECDYYMYQRMLTFVSRVALEVLPPPALNFFNTICHNLHPFIVKTFQGMPLHVLEARLEPATRFAELISRMMKVNNSAHAASQVLENDDGREQLHQEWVTLINPKRLMEGELPGCGYEITYEILTKEMATLLRPLTAPPVYQDGLPYEAPGDTVDNYVERIDVLLRSLPIRFPQASARTIVSCVKNLSTAAMREFTMQGANSFHAWWIVKVFVDEYSQWLITSGGFMAHRAVKPGRPSPSLTGAATGLIQSSEEASRAISRGSSAASTVSGGMDESAIAGPSRIVKKRRSDDFAEDPTTKRSRLTPDSTDAPNFQPQLASFRTSFGSSKAVEAQFDASNMPDFDDSGIGLGLTSDSPARSTRSALKMRNLDRAPLISFGEGVGSESGI